MTRAALEHVLRAAAALTNESDLIVIGSQSILGQFPDAPPELLVSDEVDIYPRDRPELADLIDGAIDELSFFHDEFGYCAQGVGPTTATLPAGWETRLVSVTNANTRGAIGHCLEIHDLLAAKYVARREKDRRFCRDAARRGLVDRAVLLERVDALGLDDERKRTVLTDVQTDFA
jgi:hypothetical protein